MDPRQESPKTTEISPIDCFIFINSFTAAQRVSFVGRAEEEDVRRLYGSGFALKLATGRGMAQESGGRGVVGLPSSNRMHDFLAQKCSDRTSVMAFRVVAIQRDGVEGTSSTRVISMTQILRR
jgi:hypothetical protein